MKRFIAWLRRKLGWKMPSKVLAEEMEKYFLADMRGEDK